MNRQIGIITTLIAGALLGGCINRQPGSSRRLGQVGFAAAFTAARNVMEQYYELAETDVDTGVIKSRPTPTDAANERLLGGSRARHLATLRLYRQDGEVVAQVCVAVQRQGSSVRRLMPPADQDYDSVPHQTPAEMEAATTAEQNQSWSTHRYDHVVERRILDDLYHRLHPSK